MTHVPHHHNTDLHTTLFFLLVWLVFIKFQWLPWNRTWKIFVSTVALAIALVVVGALQYYTPASQVAVVSATAAL